MKKISLILCAFLLASCNQEELENHSQDIETLKEQVNTFTSIASGTILEHSFAIEDLNARMDDLEVYVGY